MDEAILDRQAAKLSKKWWAQFKGPYNRGSVEWYYDWDDRIVVKTLAGDKVFYSYEDYHEFIKTMFMHYRTYGTAHPAVKL